MSFIQDFVSRNSKNQNGDFIVGYYLGNKIDKELIQKYPFEILFYLDHTFLRLKVLEFWNKITSCIQFICQKSFNYIFGFEVENPKIFLDKICQTVINGGTYSTENKIHISSYLISKIKSEIEELKPTIMLRFLAEIELRKKQDKGEKCESIVSEYENIKYRKILLRMYMLSCLKVPSFNIDSTFRIRLKCDVHSHAQNITKQQEVCPCLYGMDDWTIQEILAESIKRDDIIEIEKKKWFFYSASLEKYRLKDERTNEIIKYLKKFPYEITFWRDLGASWKINIYEDNEMMN